MPLNVAKKGRKDHALLLRLHSSLSLVITDRTKPGTICCRRWVVAVERRIAAD